MCMFACRYHSSLYSIMYTTIATLIHYKNLNYLEKIRRFHKMKWLLRIFKTTMICKILWRGS